ncbi:MAG TPA: DUF4105 domain-containing protein [Rhodanobacteraceae bacterium]
MKILPLGFLAVFVLALCAGMPTAHAGVADAPGADLQVSLITYGPGAIYWERFGHDAIEIRDTQDGQAITFNYGVFDFSQKDFLLNFARGVMRYSIDAEPAQSDIAYYIAAGRFVHREHLALTPAQAASLRNFLLWNLQPGHRLYHYEYFKRNCATRVRDALNQALGGALKAQLLQPSNHITFRRETDRLMSAQPWLMLALDLGLSGRADVPLNRWQAAFIPMQFMREMRRVRVPDDHGGTRPLVTSDQLVAAARLPAPPREPPNLIAPLLIIGLVLGIILAFTGHFRDTSRPAYTVFAVLGTLWLLFAGIAGIGMMILWAFTFHYTSWANENLFLFNPLALLLIVGTWRRVPSRMVRVLAWLSLAAAVFALIAKTLPGFDQQNLPWICFGVPPWLAMTWVLGKRGRLAAPRLAKA